MKRPDAQFILSAYRGCGEDASNPEFREALQLAETDADLGAWLDREKTIDRLMLEKLLTVAPPVGLRDRIWLGAQVSRRSVWSRATRWMALAAALLIFSIMGSYYIHSNARTELANFAVDYANKGIGLQKESGNLSLLTSWLAEQKLPVPANIPERLAALEKLGCRKVSFQGRDVSVICFAKDGKEYHLFVSSRMREPLFALLSGRKLVDAGKWSAAAWSDASHDYVLASTGDRTSIERLL